METIKLLKGDNRELLKTLEDNSIDSVVTDPPYALTSIKNRFGKPGSAEAQYGTDGAFQRASKGFMGKEWDSEVPSVELWKEVLRVLKPGGHVLSFGGTRTYHHLVMNMELAGFEIRDTISYMYGSGFPKSHNIGKAVDKLNGNEREVVGVKEHAKKDFKDNLYAQDPANVNNNKIFGYGEEIITKGQSDWEGWGTALKPSMELICLARKPLSEKSIAENVLKHGTGGINIDDCRVEYENTPNPATNPKYRKENGYKLPEPGQESNGAVQFTSSKNEINTEGRFPANTILECICDEVIPGEKGEIIEHNESGGIWNEGTKEPVGRTYNDKGDIHTNPECPCYILDKQSGISKSTGSIRKKDTDTDPSSMDFKHKEGENSNPYAGQTGGASRYFYTAKVSKKERNMGLDDFEEKENKFGNQKNGNDIGNGSVNDRFTTQPRKNHHPTIKPVNLMTYLCRLITPPNGVILDMYMGSGSTGISALLEGFKFVGMEMDDDYFNIAEARINNFEQYRQFIKK